ncbi:MAG: hypothetical protein M0Z66_05770 [Thermaerobacter sp.]|nr:hypothetical protein [Thermaerobacter sp.]
MKAMSWPTLRATGVALAALLALSGCAPSTAPEAKPALPKRVGDFTLQWVKGNGALLRSPQSISIGNATFTIGSGRSYLITASMPDGRPSASEPATCPPVPVWQVDLAGPEPGMLCPEPGGLVLELFSSNGPGKPLGASAADIIRGAPPAVLSPNSLGGYIVAGGVVWWLRASGGTTLASGILSTLTSATAALPPQLLPSAAGTRLLSLSDQLYILQPVATGYDVSHLVLGNPEHLEVGLEPLGAVPLGHVWAIDQDGGIWMTTKAGTARIDLIRAVPGQADVSTWHAKGQLVGVGLGFLAYLAPAAGQKTLHLMFPLSHRTLVVRGLRPPFASMQQAEDGSIYLYLHLATGRRVVRIAWSPLK